MSVLAKLRPVFLTGMDGLKGSIQLVEIRPAFKQRYREKRVDFERRKNAGVDFEHEYVFKLRVDLTYARKSDRELMLVEHYIESVGFLMLDDKSLGREGNLCEIFECSVIRYRKIPSESLRMLCALIAESLQGHFKLVMDTRNCRPD